MHRTKSVFQVVSNVAVFNNFLNANRKNNRKIKSKNTAQLAGLKADVWDQAEKILALGMPVDLNAMKDLAEKQAS
jgi:hypothetical protein